MTLVQVLVDETALHMSCDFRLTDVRTGEVMDDHAHKLVALRRSLDFSGVVGVTGLAHLGALPTSRWIAILAETGSASETHDQFLNRLAAEASRALPDVLAPALRRLTFVVGAIIGSQTAVSLVSNFERFVDGRIERSDVAMPSFTSTSIKPKGPQVFVTGAADALTDSDRDRMILSLRTGASDATIQVLMSQTNENTSRQRSTVSAGCHVCSLHITGRGSAQAFLTEAQQGDFIPPESQLMFEKLGIRLNPKIGADGRPMPIRMVSSASTTMGSTQKYFDEQLKLEPSNSELWNNYGVFLSGNRKPRDAISAFEKAIALDRGNVTAIANLADHRWRELGDTAGSNGLYAEAVRLSEPGVPAWIVSGYAEMCEHGIGDMSRARDLHAQAATADDFPLAKARFGVFMLEHEDDAAAAESLIALALQREPDNPEILHLAGLAAWRFQGKPDIALAHLHKACLTGSASGNTFWLAADLALSRGELETASYYYKKALRRGVSTWEVESNYGLVLLLQGKLDGAQRHFRRACSLSPSEPAVLINFAAAEWAGGKRPSAIARLRHLLREPLALPEHELEALAMLVCAGHASHDQAHRYEELLGEGVIADGQVLRAMFHGGSSSEFQKASTVADAIECRVEPNA